MNSLVQLLAMLGLPEDGVDTVSGEASFRVDDQIDLALALTADGRFLWLKALILLAADPANSALHERIATANYAGALTGGGAQSKVYLGRYEGEQGTLVGVLKPVKPGASAMILLSRDESYTDDYAANPATASTQVIERNLATCRLAEQIGCRVAAGSFAAEMPDGTPALFMERVHGHEARAIETPIDSADLRKGLVGLQLLDLLSAQVDRNLGNIMLKTEGGRHLPVAIDHDTSFVTARSASELSGPLNHDTVGLSLPTVVDTSMRDRVLAMTRNDLTTIMGPLADSAERLEAAVSRLTEMQDHLRAGPPAVLVVEPDGWDSAAVKDRLAADPGNYWQFLTQVPRSGD